MLYCIADAKYPLHYVSSGNLVNNDQFVHPKRNLDTFVFIFVQEGTLHINQCQHNYDIEPNQFILLFPEHLHYGYKPSTGKLSYYWVHFRVSDPSYNIYNRGTLLRNEEFIPRDPLSLSTPYSPTFFLPEYGTVSHSERRLALFFSQLLDISKRENYRASWRCHYALSLLLMELTEGILNVEELSSTDAPPQILDIIEWIRTHYDRPVTVVEIAERFNYHPTYLTGLFKKHTGYSIISYINRTRINVSKNLLNDSTMPITIIAHLCGFSDEKHYMKLFKKYEGITPSQYRQTFHQKKINIT